MPLPDSGTIAIHGADAKLKYAALIRLPEHVLKQITASAIDRLSSFTVSLEDGIAFIKPNGDKIHLSSSAESNPTNIYELNTEKDALEPVAIAKARLYTLTANAKRIADLAKKDIVAKAGFDATRGNFAKSVHLPRQPEKTILELCGGKPTKPSATGVAMARTQSSPATTGDKATKTQTANGQINHIATLRDRGIAGKPAIIMQLAIGPMRELELVTRTGYPAEVVKRVAGTEGIGFRNKFDPRKYELDPNQYRRVKTTDYDKYTHYEKRKFLELARKAYDELGFHRHSEEFVELERKEKEHKESGSTSSTGTASIPTSTESKYSDLPRVKDNDEKRGNTKSATTDSPSEPSSTKSKVSALPRIPRIPPGQQQPAPSTNIPPPPPVRPPTEEEINAREAAERFARNFVPAKKKGSGNGKWAGKSGTDMKRGASMPNTKAQNGIASPRFPDKAPLPVHNGIKANKSPLSVDKDNKAVKSPHPPVDPDGEFIYLDKQGKPYKTPRPVHFASKKHAELWHRDNIDYSTDDESVVDTSQQENDVSAAKDEQNIKSNKDGPATNAGPTSYDHNAGYTAPATTAVHSGPTAPATNAVQPKKRLSPKEEQLAALPPRPAQGCPVLPLPKKEGSITPPLLPILRWEPGATPPIQPVPLVDPAPAQSRQSSGSGPVPSQQPIPDGGNKRKTPPISLDLQANQKPRITPPDSTKVFTELRERWEALTPAYEKLAQKLKEISLAASKPSSAPRIEVSVEEVKVLTARWQGWHNELAAISARFGENTP